MSDSLRPHEPLHARPPCPSPTPGIHPNPCPLCWWRHPTISSSVVPFSSCPQSFPASGSFQMNQLSASGGQSIGVSASTSVPPMNTQDWSPRSVNERTLIYFLKKQKNKKTPKKPNFQILDVFDIQPLSSAIPHMYKGAMYRVACSRDA